MKALINCRPQHYVLKAVLVTSVAAFLVLIACQPDERTAEPPIRSTAEPTVESTAEPTVYNTGEIMEITVGPDLVDCVGVAPQKCLVVDGSLFYDGIDSFNYSEGYTWRLKVERYDACPTWMSRPRMRGGTATGLSCREQDLGDTRGPRPAETFNDNFGIYVDNTAAEYLLPPSSMQELVDEADVIAIGSVAAVVATGYRCPITKPQHRG